MAWIDENDMRRATASVLRMANPSLLPTHWTEPIQACIEEAYQYIRRVLAGRGFTADQIESWDEKRVYNRRVALCMLFEEKGLPDDYNGQSLDRVCKGREELLTADVASGGVVLIPAAKTGLGVGYGDNIDDDTDGHIALDTVL